MLLFRMILRIADGSRMRIGVRDRMTVNDRGRIELAKARWDEHCIVPISECRA